MPTPLDRDRLATVHFVPPTPFTADGGEVRLDVLRTMIARLAAAGGRVFLPAAGTGEFHSLSAAEAIACVRATREAAGPNSVVVAPLGLATHHAITVGRAAVEAGADAALLMPPVHPYVSDQGFRDYFHAISQAVPLPFLTYKRGSAPSDRLLLELAQQGRLVGVKYAVNEMDQFARFADASSGRLGLYCGTAERYAPYFMLAGAEGYTSGAGCICPRITLRMHRDLRAGKFAEALKWQRILRPIEDERARDGDSYNITLIKYGVELRGLAVGPPRPPQRILTESEKDSLRKILEPILAVEARLEDHPET